MVSGHGELTEDILEDICARIFGPDLVLRSPIVVEESGEKEVADILVLVDDIVFVIQSKSLTIDISELTEKEFGRIRKRHNNAKKQLNTLLNAANRRAEVRGTTCLGVDIALDWSTISHVICMVTLNLPDDIYEKPEFRFQYPESYCKQRGFDVHTFVLRDLWEASVELTTPGDALYYLKARKKCFITERFEIGNELDLLALYKTDYPKLEEAISDPECRVLVSIGYWEEYRTARIKQIKKRDERLHCSYMIDKLIRQLKASVEYSREIHGFTSQESALGYLLIIGKLGKLARIERAEVAKSILEKVEKTKNQPQGYFIYLSLRYGIAYLFLLLNEEDREKRRKFLLFLAEQACFHIDSEERIQATEIVAIVTDGAQSKESSIDVTIINSNELLKHKNPCLDRPLFEKSKVSIIDEW